MRGEQQLNAKTKVELKTFKFSAIISLKLADVHFNSNSADTQLLN
jgi:hypothetical protein